MSGTARTPAWLARAVSRARAVDVGAHRDLVLPAAGDICVLSGMDGEPRRLHGVVIRADAERAASASRAPRACLVMLVSGDADAATNLDVILEPDESGVPYAVAVRSDFVAPVLVAQCGRAVGSIGSDWLLLLRGSLGRGAASFPPEKTGLPIRSSDDPRMAIKSAERDHFDRMTACARRELMTPEIVINDITADEGPSGLIRAFEEGAVLPLAVMRSVLADCADLGLGPDCISLMAPQDLHRVSLGLEPSGAAVQKRRSRRERGRAEDKHLQDEIFSVGARTGCRSVRIRRAGSAPEVQSIEADGQPTMQAVMAGV